MATRFEIISQTIVRSIASDKNIEVLRIGLPTTNLARRPLVTALNFVCSLIRTCCNTAKCGLLQVLGTTTLVLRLQTSFVSLAALSPT
jgi:hypothetical protein